MLLQPHRVLAYWFAARGTGNWGRDVLAWGVALALAAVLLLGCAGGRTGADYAGLMQNVGPPRPGQSRIVLLSEKSEGLGLDAASCDVRLDGSPTSQLKQGSYVYVDRPAGQHQLVATQTVFPGETKRDITTQSARTYFFLAKASERANTLTGMTLAGGLAGMLVASAVTSGSDNLGPVDLFPLDEATARTTIAELRLAE